MHKYDNSSSLDYRQKLKIRIQETATPMFKKMGPKAVRMDDIANALSISKRTLYEIYDNKEKLLLACVKRDSENFTKRLSEYAEKAENELDIVVTFFRLKFDELDSVTAEFLSDIDKYESVNAFFRQSHDEHVKESANFMRKCVEKGFFAPTIDCSVFQDICDTLMESRFIDRLYGRYTIRDIFRNYFVVLLRGLCTEKGLALLDLYLKKSSL